MEQKFDISLYNDEFFEWHQKHAHEYSVRTMNWLIDNFHPTSVCDFGCGIGSYLYAAKMKGIKNLKGFDIGGEHARKYTPEIIQPYIEYADCTKPIFTKEQYDCVLSFETAEHIDPSGTDTFIDNIVEACKIGGRILFTAAPPGQEGCGHINCHPADYWIRHFVRRGLKYALADSADIGAAWITLDCPSYIVNNLLVFIKPILA